MTIIKPSTAFKSNADWVSGEVLAYAKDQLAIHVDTVADVNGNDFESARWVWVRALSALYRLDPASAAADDATTVLRDNVGRRYVKATANVAIAWSASGTLANRATYNTAAQGFVYAATDGADLVLYVKKSATSGDWSAGFTWRGAAGASAGVTLTYSTSTADADPGAGTFRFNNATVGSATAAYIDNLESGGSSITAWLDTFDDSTATVRGTLTLRGVTQAAAFAVFDITGSVVDGTGYRKLTLAHRASGGAWVNGNSFALTFSRTGNNGVSGVQSSNATVTDIVKVSQAAYDALSPPSATTLYIVTG